MVKRPWTGGFGWLIALIVVILAVLALVGSVAVAHLPLLLILGLAIAILVG